MRSREVIRFVASSTFAFLALAAAPRVAAADEPEQAAAPTSETETVTTKHTTPRYWLTAAGSITLGGAYVANAVLAPIALFDPPDGIGTGGDAAWYLVPVVGPFALAAKLNAGDTGLRRFEWIDGTLQAAGLAAVIASFVFPVEVESKPTGASIQPILSPHFVGAAGTF